MHRAFMKNAEQDLGIHFGIHWIPSQPSLQAPLCSASSVPLWVTPLPTPSLTLAGHDLAELKSENLQPTMTTNLDNLANYQQQRLIVSA